MDAISIRLAKPDERLALEELQRRASLVWEDYREALLANPDAIALPESHVAEGRVLVAEVHGDLLGFAVVLPRADGGAELDGMFVEPTCWRGGIGRALIFHAQQAASKNGAHSLHVIANPRALGFYEKCGFVEEGRAETRFGPGITMRKPLPLRHA